MKESVYKIRVENDPETFSQAMTSKESDPWHNSMIDNMISITSNQEWDLLKFPNGEKVIGCKWIFKTKRDSLGNTKRHKEKLVVKGFT